MSDLPGPCAATFHATYAVLKAEKTLKQLGIPVKMIPVPRQISSNCGIAIRFAISDLSRIREALLNFRGDLEGIYCQNGEGAYRRLDDSPSP